MSAEQAGPSRRLTAEQEAEGARMYAAGASEREVADKLGCSASTAHRLRERLPAEARAGDQADGPADPWELTEVQPAVDVAAELAELATALAELDRVSQTHEARAQASRDAVAALEAERLQVLAAGRDASPLRPRIASAREDLADSETAAQLARGRMVPVQARIAELEARRDLDAVRAELAAAVAARDAVLARAGERQRAAVLAVKTAAEEFTATYREEQAAGLRVEQLAQAVAARAVALGEPLPDVPPAVSTALAVSGDTPGGGALALVRATYRAREGNVAAVAAQLAECMGWLPPSPEELAADRAVWEARAAALAATVPAAAPSVEHPAHWPASVSVDSQGRPLAPPDPERPRPPQAPVQPGALGFMPWPR